MYCIAGQCKALTIQYNTKAMFQVEYAKITRRVEGMVERLIQHEVKLGAVFVSRPCKSAIFNIFYEHGSTYLVY